MEVSSEKKYKNSGNADVLSLVTGENIRVLDVGCGSGDNARILNQKGCKVDGITISKIELECAAPFLDRGYLFNLEMGLPSELQEDAYDFVICSHVLEHICYPEKLISDIRRVLKTDGFLIVALPNIMHYKSRWEILKGNFTYKDSGIWDYTHFRWYTFNTGKELLEQYGFNVLAATVTGEIPAKSILGKILSESVMKKVYSILTGWSKGLFGYQLLYKACKQKTKAF
jgi:2-polyprenyl-3-methyl-5-hydroxy-6-metoxy-1,4-benzoquinol methylase